MTGPRRALVVVDVQQEYFDGVLQIQYPPRAESLANIVSALEVAVAHDLPVAIVQHEMPAGAPAFVKGTPTYELHPDIEAQIQPSFKRVEKKFSSVFAGTGVAEWLTAEGVDTVTIVGYMTNNCDLASAADAEVLDVTTEILSDATGAINLSNEAGTVSAEQLHKALMVLYHSNFAAVATTSDWTDAVKSGSALSASNLVVSAAQGNEAVR
ncbi:isochorismatase family protein [Rhodococcus sp. H36-A4]|uniref:isochorismatase family protein n=1 Tax=Rhodococcus sp. H36-A4 TaxID=3004353 RepID=UPI0022AF6D2D|nr:isochorismatase family protein [Rhodococcus sp. H36-A4]MCZ4080186.1 isochorismatase family protein [Rhodococcus sp. H36-A4]